jgi:hypothetical protein
MKFNRLISPAKSTPPGVPAVSARDRLEQLEPLLLMSASAHDLDLVEDMNPDAPDAVGSGLDSISAETLTEFTELSDTDLLDLAVAGWPTPLTADNADGQNSIAGGAAEPATDTEPLREVVFIDASTPDLDALLTDLRNAADPNREFTAILLSEDRGGIEQITAALSNLQNIAAVHIVSHGSEGRVELGNEILDLSTISNHLSAIESWAHALTADADILIYGCDLAAADSGRALMQFIADASGGDVAASDDATGAETKGGDWILEEQVGNVSTKVAFSGELWAAWDHILANYTGTAGDDVIAASNGNDSIDGLGGIDTVVYSGNYAEYVISGTPDKIIDDQTPGRDGTDTLTNVERAEFLDGVYDLTNNTFSPWVAPSLTTSGLTLTYTENSGPIAIDDQLTLSDAESATLNSATVRITGNYNSTQDLLSFTNQSGISGAWDSSTGTLTLTGSASVANYEAALRSVTYSNNSDAPSTSNRTISITASDAQLTSIAATRTIAVVATNDTPVGLPTITGFVREDQTLTADTSAISDADGPGSFSYQWRRTGADIIGATSSTYTAGDADVDTQLSVRVRYTDAFGTLETVTSAQTAAVQNVNDAPTGLPLITGTATENQTLTANVSALADIDGIGTISYQWLRNGASISGATASTYTTSDPDVGSEISLRISYTDGHGTVETVTSATTAAIQNINDTPVGLPVIQGTIRENQTLTANTSAINDADGLGTFSYQWLRNGANITGATAATYTTGDADVGSRLSVRVSYIDDQGTAESLTSAETASVQNVNDTPSGSPVINGVLREAETLTADVSGITDNDGLGTFSYQWLRNGSTIVGATGTTYSTSNADVGANLAVRITYTDVQGTVETVTSASTASIQNINDTPNGLPLISGLATEDQTLTADTSGISDDDDLGTFSYQWLRNGTNISGATNSTYTSTDADVGSAISVRVRYTDGHGTLESLTSSSTAAITGINDTPVGLPVIQGTISENQTLVASTAGLTDADGLGAFSYQWLRNGSAISGATNSNYTTGDADVGTTLSVQISYTDNQGTTETLTSASTTAVQNVNDLPIGLPVLSGVFQEDQTLTANVAGISDIDGLGAFSYQWLRNGSAISGATSANYFTTDADVETRISVRVSFVDGLETTETLTSAQSSTIAAINDAPTGLPTISGTPEEDRLLTVNVSGINDADGLNAFSYQWLRNGAAIIGANAANYTPRDADVGTQLSVRVSWTDDQGFQESLTSVVSSPVANINDTPTGRPTVSGSALEDQTLQAVTSDISDIDGLGTLQYQWLRDGQDISGAGASNYRLVDADVDARISVRVSWTDGYGTTESVTSLTSSSVVNINDTPVGEPVIVGIATEDQVLTADVSSLSDGDGLGTFRYQWLRDGANISGATASTYRPTDADVDSRISVEVSYTDGHGLNEVLTSFETSKIAAINDTPVGLPEVSGSPVEGQTLTARVNTVSDADGLGSIQYQWLRNGSEITGATSATYTTGDSDVGTQLSVVIRYTDAQGTQETLASVPTTAIANVNDEATGRPEIQGNAVEDQLLTATTSSLADNDGLGAFQYQWLRDGVAISGATNDSYRLSDADVNAQIRIRITYTDALGSTEVITSSATDAVENIDDALTGQIFLVGNAEQNSTLTVDSSGLRDDDGLGTLQYRWYRDGEEIAGATSASYTLVENDVNTRISARVEYTDDHGTDESANSDSTGRVLNVNDNPVGLPSITGITTEDQTLTANTDGIRDDDGVGEYSIQWLRDGVAIEGANDETFSLKDEDVGSMISLRVTYTDGHGKIEQLDSVATAAIANVEDAPSVTIVSNQQIDQLRGTGTLQFQVSDVDTQSRFLIVTATSSDLHVVPIENIIFGGIGQFRTIEILPTSTDTQAQSVITVTVSDGTTSTTMSFTVTARGVLTPNSNGDGNGNSGKDNGNGPAYARGNEGNQDEVDALIHASSGKDQKKSSDDDSDEKQTIEAERGKNLPERPKETTAQSSKGNRDEAPSPDQQAEPESQNQTVIRTEDSSTTPPAPREAEPPTSNVTLTGVDELSLVPNEVHSATPTDVEIAVEESLTAESIEDASSAVLTSVVAVGAMSAIGKGSAVGVIGTSTTTNTYLYVTSKGQLAAAKTFETIVGHMSNIGGTTSSGALMAQQIQWSGVISSGVVTGSSAALATIASTIPIWYSFDPIVILDRFATEYAPLDAAENSGLLSLLNKPG